MSIALAIFVKTPGLSPVKTRLATSIGQELAEDFYKRSLKATASIAQALRMKINTLDIFWAVAEVEGIQNEYWKDFKVVGQGSGSLGERLSFVYEELRKEHDFVFFIGADSPHLDYLKLLDAFQTLDRNKFIIGATDDGGFYLFGGALPINKSIWSSVEYSVDTTCLDLCEKLNKLADISYINKDFDIDQLDDFCKYDDPTFNTEHLLPEQKNIIEWTIKHIRTKR